MTVRAFLVSVKGSPRFDSVVLTTSASKARAVCVNAAGCAGYGFTFAHFVVRRAPELDRFVKPWPCSRRYAIGRAYARDGFDRPCNCTTCNACNERSEASN